MSYASYQFSRDAAWRFLIEEKITKLPVELEKVYKRRKIKLLSYKHGAKMIRELGLEDRIQSGDGFIVDLDGPFIVFFNETKPRARIRFTIAHELGHIILGHTIGPDLINREPEETDNPTETEANIFAARILAPACVLHKLGVTTPEQIAKVCDISLQAARFRFNRLVTLRERDKFFFSPLERLVYQQFLPYIQQNQL